VPVPVTVISAGAGRLGGEVRIGNDDTETLWLAAVQPGGETLAATFDGTTWTGLPIIAGPGYGTGAVALIEYNDQLYAFYEHSELLQVSVFDDATQRWAIMGPVPGVSYPQSTCVTIAGDLLYLNYLCADPSTTATPTYLVAFDGEEWLAPVIASTDNASGSSIAGFIDQVIQVYLGTNGIMYGQWTGSGGAAWHGKTALGAAFTAPGLLPVSTTAGDDTHAQGLLGLAGWSGTYNGLFTREMTTPVT
jgi:hypothetical protein